MTSETTFLGFDASGDKVWQHADGRVTYNDTLQGAEWSFECGGGQSLEKYVGHYGPITKEKK